MQGRFSKKKKKVLVFPDNAGNATVDFILGEES
jgi:hypothetical protein